MRERSAFECNVLEPDDLEENGDASPQTKDLVSNIYAQPLAKSVGSIANLIEINQRLVKKNDELVVRHEELKQK